MLASEIVLQTLVQLDFLYLFFFNVALNWCDENKQKMKIYSKWKIRKDGRYNLS